MNPKYIIIHHSGTGDTKTFSTQAIRKYHMRVRGYLDIAYQFLCEDVNGEYEIIVGRPMNKAGAHCKGYNRESIGFCFVGNFDEGPPPKEQFDKAAKFIASLCQMLHIPIENVMRHKDLSNTDCPGRYFSLNQFQKEIQKYIGV